MKLVTKTIVADSLFRNKAGCFYDNETMTEKCLAILGYSHPLPEGMSLYYFSLVGKKQLVIELYKYEECQ